MANPVYNRTARLAAGLNAKRKARKGGNPKPGNIANSAQAVSHLSTPHPPARPTSHTAKITGHTPPGEDSAVPKPNPPTYPPGTYTGDPSTLNIDPTYGGADFSSTFPIHNPNYKPPAPPPSPYDALVSTFGGVTHTDSGAVTNNNVVISDAQLTSLGYPRLGPQGIMPPYSLPPEMRAAWIAANPPPGYSAANSGGNLTPPPVETTPTPTPMPTTPTGGVVPGAGGPPVENGANLPPGWMNGTLYGTPIHVPTIPAPHISGPVHPNAIRNRPRTNTRRYASAVARLMGYS